MVKQLQKMMACLLAGIIFSMPITAFAQQEQEISVKELMGSSEPEKSNDKAAKPSPINRSSGDEESFVIPADEFQRGTPRGAIEGYLNAARELNFALAAQYLDLRNLDQSVLALGGEKLAEQLYMILNRALWIDLDSVSDHPQGNLNETVPVYRELLGFVGLDKGKVSILLQHVPRKKDRVKIWKISNSTIAKVPLLVQKYGYSPTGEWLSERLPDGVFWGVAIWQWFYFVMVAFGSYLLAKILTWITAFILGKTYKKTSIEVLTFIRGPISLLLTVLLTRALIDDANKTLAVKAISEGGTLLIVAWGWVFLRSIDLLKVILAKRFVAQDKPLAVYLLRPAGNVAKSFIVVFSLLIWFENLGFSASTLLAGLGIGGLAIALAAQKTVENIIGAITLYTSAPVKIGSFCKFGDKIGFVEEIGLRATRVRTLERTVVYIANAQFVDMQLENYSERERIAYRPKLSLSTQCKKQDIESFVKALKSELSQLAFISAEPLRVNFVGFDAWSLNIEVLSYINTTDFEEYLSLSEQLNFTILSLLEQYNCSLSALSDVKNKLL